MLSAFVDGRLFGARFGTSEPKVVALHGWGRSHLDYVPMFERAAATGCSGIAIDLPGFGATPVPPEAWGSGEYAELISLALAEIGHPVVVVGHSFGGRIALHLAAGFPEQVSGLLLTGVPQLGPPVVAASPRTGYRMVRALRRAHLLNEARLDAARERYGSEDYRAADGVMRAVLVRALAERYDEQLEAIRQPVELVWGSADTAAPPATAERAEGLLHDAHLTVLNGVGHLLPTESPAALAAALVRLGC